MNDSNKIFNYVRDISVHFDKSNNVLVHEYVKENCRILLDFM